jgi:hypothetical protein
MWVTGVADAEAGRLEFEDAVCCEAAKVSVLMVWTKAWKLSLGAVVFGLCDIGMGTIECSGIDGAKVVAGAETCDGVGALILPGNIAAERRVPIVPSRWTLLEVLEAEDIAVTWPVPDGRMALELLPWPVDDVAVLVAFELWRSAPPVGTMGRAAGAPVARGAMYSCLMDSIIALTFIFLA